MYEFDSNIKSALNTLREYGICRIPNYLNVNNLLKEVNEILKTTNEINYDFGKYKSLSNNNYKQYKEIKSTFENKDFLHITKWYLNKNTKPTEVVITHDYKSGNAKNGLLHYDPKRSLKFFIYLTDVSKDDGPFSVIPKTHHKGKELRESNEPNKSKIFIDFPQLNYSQNDIIPIIGNAGDLIIFDSDIFHLGGKVNNGERIIIRSHTYI